MVGIVSYGFYVPQFRLAMADIAKIWGKKPDELTKSLHLQEKAVAGLDEDVVTMAYQAGAMALKGLSIDLSQIGCVFFGSETFPYVVKPASTIVSEWLGIGHNYLSYDTEFACKAATGALISAIGLVEANKAVYGLVYAADKANAKPQDALECTAGAGANAWLVGKQGVILEVVDSFSFSTDTPDFWRRSGADYPSHAGRFSGQPGYFYHVGTTAKELMRKHHYSPEDFNYAVFHMPNGRFPVQIGLSLGFTKKQIEPSLVVTKIGNTYSASALMGLVSVLEIAKAGDSIFFASYGSGAGSDAIIFKVTDFLVKRRQQFQSYINKKTYIDYPTYLKYMGIIHQ